MSSVACFVSFFEKQQLACFVSFFRIGVCLIVFAVCYSVSVLFHFLENSRGRVNDFWISGCGYVLFHFLENSRRYVLFHFSELPYTTFCFIF